MATQEDTLSAPQVFRRDGAELLEAFGQRVWILLPASATNGAASFAEVEVPPGEGPPYHVHRQEDETFIVREGRFEFIINTEPTVLRPASRFCYRVNNPDSSKNMAR